MRLQRFLVLLTIAELFAPQFSGSQPVRERRLTHTSYKDFLFGWCPKDQAPVVDLRGLVRGEVTAFGGRALPKPRGEEIQEWKRSPQPGRLYATAQQPNELDALWLYHRPNFTGPLRWSLWSQLPVSDTPRWIVTAHGSLWTTGGGGLESFVQRADETSRGGPWVMVANLLDGAKPEGFFLTGDDQIAIPARLRSGETIALVGDFTGDGKSVSIKGVRQIRARRFQFGSGRLPAIYMNRFTLGGSVRVERLEWTLTDGSQGDVRVRYRCASSKDQPFEGWSSLSRTSPINIGKLCNYCEYQIVFPAGFGGSLEVDEVALVYEEREEDLAAVPGSSASGTVGGLESESEPQTSTAMREQTQPAEQQLASSPEDSSTEPVLTVGGAQEGEERSGPGDAGPESESEQSPAGMVSVDRPSEPSVPADTPSDEGTSQLMASSEDILQSPDEPSHVPGSPGDPTGLPDGEDAKGQESGISTQGDLQSAIGDPQSPIGTAREPHGSVRNPRSPEGAPRGDTGEPGGGRMGLPVDALTDVGAEAEPLPAGAGPPEAGGGGGRGAAATGGGAGDGEAGSVADAGSGEIAGGMAGQGAGIGGIGSVVGAGGGGSSGASGDGSHETVSDATVPLFRPLSGADTPTVAEISIETSSRPSWWLFLGALMAAVGILGWLLAIWRRQKERGTALVRSLSAAPASTVADDYDVHQDPQTGNSTGGIRGGGTGSGGRGAGKSGSTFVDPSRWGGQSGVRSAGSTGEERRGSPMRAMNQSGGVEDSSLGSGSSRRNITRDALDPVRSERAASSPRRLSLFGLALPPFFYLLRRKRVTSVRKRSS